MKSPLVLGTLLLLAASPRAQTVLHVSPVGDDRWSGRLESVDSDGTDGPFASLERARDAIRQLVRESGLPEGGVEVRLADGVYPRRESFVLTGGDGGSVGAPIVYRAAEGARPRLMGGAFVTGFAGLSDGAIHARLDPATRDQVLVADLREQGIEEYGTLVRRGFGRSGVGAPPELYFGGQPMQLARWPNEDWARIAEAPEGKDGGLFTYGGQRHERWAEDAEVWVHGYWTWDWADSVERVTHIDREKGRVHTAEPHGVYGYKPGARCFFFNLLEELDRPGEWFLDRAAGLLYFWPPAPVESAEVQLSLLEDPLVVLEETSHVTLRGLALECSRGGGVRISGGAGNLVAGCELARLGTLAARIEGERNGLLSCDLFQLGEGGVAIGGGRDNRVENNVFVDCGHAVHIDERGKGWASYYFDGSNTTLFDRLEAIDGTGPLYTARYPQLATLLEDDPISAKGNIVARNIRWGGGWLELNNGLSEETPYLRFEHNWVEGDPGFEDPAGGDYALRDSAPVLSSGFRPLPLDEIGLFEDEHR